EQQSKCCYDESYKDPEEFRRFLLTHVISACVGSNGVRSGVERRRQENHSDDDEEYHHQSGQGQCLEYGRYEMYGLIIPVHSEDIEIAVQLRMHSDISEHPCCKSMIWPSVRAGMSGSSL